jgi:hypothetical protein
LNNGSAVSAQLSSHLSSHVELLASNAELPIVWFASPVFANQRLHEILKFGLLEIQEHFETFLDKKEHAFEVFILFKF